MDEQPQSANGEHKGPGEQPRQRFFSEDWFQLYDLYESGKGRRYGLLFTINGGAYALVGFLIGKDSPINQLVAQDQLMWSPITAWAFIVIPAVMILYTILMYRDINAFGTRMRDYGQILAGRHPNKPIMKKSPFKKNKDPDLFGHKGRRHLILVCLLLGLAWIGAGAVAACTLQ